MSNAKVYSGTVSWFDRASGRGVIRSGNSNVSVFACNIIGAKTMFEHTACMYLLPDQDVTFSYDADCGAFNVSGGTFDSENWDRIKDQDLAFRKNDDGSFSGLFARSKE